MKKTVVIGVTSGIAAFKTIELVRLLRKEGIEVFVIMTASAAKMVSPSEFAKASGHKVAIELFEKDFNYKTILKKRRVDHIDLADSADLMVIVPATANVIAKLAHGIADDFLTTTALALTSPLMLCPSMNVHMWENPIVQENILNLKHAGYEIIDPAVGDLACGYSGKGRLEDIQVIKNEILNRLKVSDSLKGKKIIVTAGATVEPIDDVRFITNKSTGKMGAAIAKSLANRGAGVLLLRANSAVKSPGHLEEKTYLTSDDLLRLIKQNIKNCAYFYHTAAVSDFSPGKPYKGKLSSKKSLMLHLTPQTKILDQIKRLNPKVKLIAFKTVDTRLESLKTAAEKKLQESDADAVVANDISKPDRGFAADTNEVVIVTKNGKAKKIPLSQKREIAEGIVEFVQLSL